MTVTSSADFIQALMDARLTASLKEAVLFEGDGAWCRFGIRDPCILSTPDGQPILDRNTGELRIYFNGRSQDISDGGTTCVGTAHGLPGGELTAMPRPLFADGLYAAAGSVLRLTPDHFRMYYSADTQKGFRLASSNNGFDWQRSFDQEMLAPAQFSVSRMGLPFVTLMDNRWIMVFEGIRKGRFAIFMASSADGLHWRPEYDGNPIYASKKDSWDGNGQANPALYRLPFGSDFKFVIAYNGCAQKSDWDIGWLVSHSLEGPWIPNEAPFLRRRQERAWSAGRLEGARLAMLPDQPWLIYLFGLPGENSYSGGRIASTPLERSAEGRAQSRVADSSDVMLAANIREETAFNDKLAGRYFRVWDEYPVQRFTHNMERKWIGENLHPGSDVVVLGSGGGREIPILLEKECRITAVDLSERMLEEGRRRFPENSIEWIRADIHDPPFESGRFDAALCLGAAFNSLHTPGHFLRRLTHVLKPGGLFFASIINAEHASESATAIRTSSARVRRLYTLPELESMFADAHLQIAMARGVRFLVDMLPPEWNSSALNPDFARQNSILEHLLSQEEKLCEHLPARRGKFIFVMARSRE